MGKFLESDIIFYDDKITFVGNPLEGLPEEFIEAIGTAGDYEVEIMMSWEDLIMKRHAEFVCENGGDILEIGFGMGISADYIQSHDPKSHTIIELHPQLAERAREWAKDKPNTTILEGDWYDMISTLNKFDGIFYDAYGFMARWEKVAGRIKGHTNEGCHITFWNCNPREKNGCGFDKAYNVVYELIEVDPPKNTYFNHKTYYLPKVVV